MALLDLVVYAHVTDFCCLKWLFHRLGHRLNDGPYSLWHRFQALLDHVFNIRSCILYIIMKSLLLLIYIAM